MVWFVKSVYHALGPFFFDEHMMDETYLNILRDKLMPQIKCLDKELLNWF